MTRRRRRGWAWRARPAVLVCLYGWIGALLVPSPSRAASLEVAEGWVHRHWTARDGLPVEGINALARGPRGYLWLATFDGLARFDGVRFTPAPQIGGDPLPSRRFTTLSAGAGGVLWLSTEPRHLVRFHDRRFEHLQPALPGDRVFRAVGRHPDGRLVFAFGGSLLPESPSEGLGKPVASVPGVRIRSFDFGPDGTLWIGTVGSGLFSGRPSGEPEAFEPVPGIPRDATVIAVQAQDDGVTWVGTPEGLWRLRAGRSEAVLLGPDPDRPAPVVHLYAKGRGPAWVTTEAGLFRIDDDRVSRLSESGLLTGSEPLVLHRDGSRWVNAGDRLLRDGRTVLRTPSSIKDFLFDPEGSLWVATADDGLLRLRRSPFRVIGADRGLPPGSIYPIVEGPPGTVWLGHRGRGLARVREGRVELFPGPPEVDFLWSLLPGAPGSGLLVGARGLWRFRDGRFTREPAPAALANGSILALYRDRRGHLWVGTYRLGVFRRTPEEGWQHLAPGTSGMPDAAVRAFLETRDGSVWMATTGGGVLRWRDGRLERLSRADGLPSDLVRALWEDPTGAVWVGTEDRGLARVRAPRGTPLARAELAPVDSSRGLYDDGVHRILPDGHGRLWMSTNRGIFWVREAELLAVADGRREGVRSTAYTEADALPSREANGGVQSAGTVTGDGRLWFPTVAGAVVVDPDDVRTNTVPPPVVVEGLRLPGSRELLAPPGDGRPLRLGSASRTFELWYTALSFVDPERVRFRYRLEGAADDWIDAGDRRRVLFADLPPGRYRFRVTAANEHGVWNEAGASLDFRLVARWWETATARGAGAILLLALLGAGVAGRAARQRRLQRHLEREVASRTEELGGALQQVRRQAWQLEEHQEARSRLFAQVSHELRTPLTLLLGPLMEAEEEPDRLAEEAPAMRRSARTLLRLADQILDLEKIETGHFTLHPEPRDLGRFARRVVEAFTGLAERWGIDLALEAPDPGPVVRIDPEQMERVLANLVSNALKFTPRGGSVRVRVSRDHDQGVVEVADTGPGIPADELPRVFERFYQVGNEPETHGVGLGLAIARELAELHGGRVEAESEPGKGATFRVRLPTTAEAPSEEPDTPDGASRPAARLRVASEEAGRAATEPAGEGGDRPAVLVVDDHPGIRGYVANVLREDFRVLLAADGAAGLELARRRLPDLVVADVAMPGMDGLEMARRLVRDPETAGMPVIFLTARTRPADRVAGLDTGAVAYLSKPFDAAALRAQVASVLADRRRLRRRLREELEPASAAAEDGSASEPTGLESRARAAIRRRLHDEGFGPEELARALALGRSLLFQRFRDELGTTPGELLRAVRLERARELLEEGVGSVTEIAYAVGFASLAGFSRAFRDRYGEPPSALLGRSG